MGREAAYRDRQNCESGLLVPQHTSLQAWSSGRMILGKWGTGRDVPECTRIYQSVPVMRWLSGCCGWDMECPLVPCCGVIWKVVELLRGRALTEDVSHRDGDELEVHASRPLQFSLCLLCMDEMTSQLPAPVVMPSLLLSCLPTVTALAL